MTKEVTSKLESLLATMAKGEEFARRGFELILGRPNPENYFDALRRGGFFDPSNNPAAVQSAEPGFVQIPYWSALDYLENVMRRAEAKSDLPLADQIMDVLRSVSKAREADGTVRDNYRTYFKFAQIISLAPTSVISLEDIELVRTWLSSKFDRSLVANTLSESVLPHLFSSGSANDIQKACRLLEFCTEFEWADEKIRGRDLVTLVDEHWLTRLIAKHAKTFGAKAGAQSARIFSDRLRQLFGNEHRPYSSSVWRPAVEESSQNLRSRGPENAFVDGLRDVIAGWIEASQDSAVEFVEKALADDAEVIRRIALHTITEHFQALHDIFVRAITPKLFTSSHRHELYRLLRERFSALSEKEKRAVLESIRAIPPPNIGEERELRLKLTQRDWLSAVVGKGDQDADKWYTELTTNASLGAPSEHPDFLTYYTTRSGPGPAPFGTDAIIAFAEDGSLVKRLNEFKQTDSWKGPTLGGLLEALESAVAMKPELFLSLRASFKESRRPFQHAFLNGLKRVLDQEAKSSALDWNATWPKLMTLFSELIGDEEFWLEPAEQNEDRNPDRDWIISLIADFLQAGTKKDDSAYAPALLPTGFSLIETLLARTKSTALPGESDPMTQALNTPKGRVIDALFNHALRACRLNTKEKQTTNDAWKLVESAFDTELAKCTDGNLEFSTLGASYIANLDYMSRDWLMANVGALFSKEYQSNFSYAVAGLGYATPTRFLYKLLAGHDVLPRALTQTLGDSHAHNRIIEWVGLAYLWGDERLNSPIIAQFFSAEHQSTLRTLSDFFWGVRGEDLKQDQTSRIMAFWASCVAWGEKQKPLPAALFSDLSRLSCYIRIIDEEARTLLLAVAPYVHTGYNTDFFIEELLRLVQVSPKEVADALARMLDSNAPIYDLDGKLKALIQELAKLGLRAEAIDCANRLSNTLPGMIELYRELIANSH
ncbi:MAG TPA: hypothetical protein VNH44_09230 [Micropepsaceae bacterium]|nr:hypothetical protein [Micropepsaceae bacterium]